MVMRSFKDVIPPDKAAFNYPPSPQEGRKDFFTIALDGQARCIIRSGAGSQRATEALKAYLDLATGADIPIAGEGAAAPPGMAVIHVGDTEVGLKTDLALPDVRYGEDAIANLNGYLVKTVDADTLVIRGLTAAGTIMGVVGFLKRYAGVRRYWHGYAGSIGDVVPKSATLRIPEVEWRDWPFFISRSMSGIDSYGPVAGPGQKEVPTQDMLRLHTTIPYGESYFRWLPSDQYGKDHPEYYPLHEDGRRHVPETPTAQGWQPCVSNPEVVRIMAAARSCRAERAENAVCDAAGPASLY